MIFHDFQEKMLNLNLNFLWSPGKLLDIWTNWAPQQIITCNDGQCQRRVPIFIYSIQVDAIHKQPIEFILISCVRSDL